MGIKHITKADLVAAISTDYGLTNPELRFLQHGTTESPYWTEPAFRRSHRYPRDTLVESGQ
jgi:hypothetical protein